MVGAGNLASVYYEQGLLDYAIVHYKQALLLDSNFLEAYNNLVCLLSIIHMSYWCSIQMYTRVSFLAYVVGVFFYSSHLYDKQGLFSINVSFNAG
jgi:tetratricopeptide (TPR) repeat protein